VHAKPSHWLHEISMFVIISCQGTLTGYYVRSQSQAISIPLPRYGDFLLNFLKIL
jgi:hypothetical protein